jgi:chromosome segregation ATPase
MSEESSWGQYSRLVLQQLETLSNGIEALRAELQDVKSQLTELKAKEDRVQDLKDWKEKIDEIASPSQLQNALQDIEDLKVFKTKAITIFAGIQFLMASALAFSKFF